MMTSQPINFGPDKSQILRGFAIIFMIALHNDAMLEFKICVPIYTFLVGYGYAFAKGNKIMHAAKRSWNLLSHFWLILLGVFLPVAIWKGGYEPTMKNVIENMFGLESDLNWYSWYVYFYIYAMLIMIPVSHLLRRFKIPGLVLLIVCSAAACVVIHRIPAWDKNIWLKAIFDCFLCSPVMFVGCYLAEGGGITKLKMKFNLYSAILMMMIATAIFFFRGLPYATFLDFITVPAFAVTVVALFNIISWSWIHNLFIALGKESMNMWFFHAIFATSYTAVAFAALVDWIEPKTVHIAAVVVISYLAGKVLTSVYNKLNS